MVALGCAISRGVNGGQEVVRSLHTHIEIEPSADRQRAGAVERKGEVVGGDENAQGLLSAERFNAHVQRYRLVQMEVCLEFRVGWSCVSRRGDG